MLESVQFCSVSAGAQKYVFPIVGPPTNPKPTQEKWRELARQASEERDPDTLVELAEQLIEKYDEEKRRKLRRIWRQTSCSHLGNNKSPQVLGQDAATSQLIKRPRHEANWTCRGYRGAVLLKLLCSTAMRCAVDTFTVKVSSVGGDSKTGFNMSVIVS